MNKLKPDSELRWIEVRLAVLMMPKYDVDMLVTLSTPEALVK